ncbi:type I toxin-antitoxin system ptaRNA1 family toxin [Pseudomonas sp. sia0905]|uniref:type I toxin-antitoxin system ptaRNA1 family toxin n=1 Tax=Pseudomonas sp. sia0905 TaxID=2854783 RepID=UPI001C45B5F5|nr:type I toxin-antitoxin system ptaRNA1 family toxin [Pseudomonas sp. sia0905]MBV7563679.1 type I toxin-antitoxin system ptaRNA1 family toxin [Pseudomonas sp. sia0905]
MANQDNTDAAQAIHQAAANLVGINFDRLDDQAVRDMKPLISAVMDTLMIAVFQAETGVARKGDFTRAKSDIGRAVRARS